MLAISILPFVGAGLLLADSALASPIQSSVRSLELTGSPVREVFPDGKYDEELVKRECVYIQEKYSRRAEHEQAVAARKPRQAKRGVATVALQNHGQNVVRFFSFPSPRLALTGIGARALRLTFLSFGAVRWTHLRRNTSSSGTSSVRYR